MVCCKIISCKQVCADSDSHDTWCTMRPSSSPHTDSSLHIYKDRYNINKYNVSMKTAWLNEVFWFVLFSNLNFACWCDGEKTGI